jgi:hypothetical protein
MSSEFLHWRARDRLVDDMQFLADSEGTRGRVLLLVQQLRNHKRIVDVVVLRPLDVVMGWRVTLGSGHLWTWVPLFFDRSTS